MKLKELRKKAGKTQQEMADILNMSKMGYNSYESGRTEPNFETLKKIADYFKTTIDNLLDREIPFVIDKSQFSNEQLELIENIKKLSSNNCKLVNAYIIGVLTAEEEKQNIIRLSKR